MATFPDKRQYFRIDEVDSILLQCSFCANVLRRDVGVGERTNMQSEKENLRRDAELKHWRSQQTVHAGTTLNYCPDCAPKAIETGFLGPK